MHKSTHKFTHQFTHMFTYDYTHIYTEETEKYLDILLRNLLHTFVLVFPFLKNIF